MTDITENGKYYIPKIEEFHIGFEYQTNSMAVNSTIKQNGVWSSTLKISVDDFLDETIADIGRSLEHDEEPCVRVKHFDQEDIESLGWHVYKNKNQYIKDNCWLCVHDDKTITIERRVYGMLESNASSITIRNKSELKRLMNQLGI